MSQNDSQLVFYEQIGISDYWTITDVLYWIAARVLPRPLYYEEDEARESQESLWDAPLTYGRSIGPDFLEPCYTELLGIEIDPRWEILEEEFNGEEAVLSSEHHKQMADFMYENESESWRRDNHNQQMKLYHKAKDRERREESWASRLEDALDQSVCELVLQLRKGALQSEGFAINIDVSKSFGDEVSEALDHLQIYQNDYESSFQSIPANAWISRNVDWDGAYVKQGSTVFLAARCDSDQVLKLYPPVSSKSVQLGNGGEYLFSNNGDASVSKPTKRTGRPSKNSDAIHRKIASVIAREGGLMAKQDAFAQEIQDWYLSEFDDTIGISTIKKKLSQYYNDANFEKSKN